MKISLSIKRKSRGLSLAFTLEEVLISLGVSGITIGSIITGYLLVLRQAEWSAYSWAAQNLAMQRVEQVRAAKWDPLGMAKLDEVVAAKFPEQVQTLDVPVLGASHPTATIRTSIQPHPTDQLLRIIQVDCIWSFLDRGVYTNTVLTCRSPDQ